MSDKSSAPCDLNCFCLLAASVIGHDSESIDADANLRDELGIDDWGLYQLLHLVETACGRSLPEELVGSLTSLRDYHYYLVTKAGH